MFPAAVFAGTPGPCSVTVIPGSPARVSIAWPDNAIANRWLRVSVKANANTGLAAPEVYYIEHLRGETTGPSGSVFTVSFADFTPIRAAVGSIVNAASLVDIDKSGTVSFNDISAIRSNIGGSLTVITIPASGGEGSGAFGQMMVIDGGGGEVAKRRDQSGGFNERSGLASPQGLLKNSETEKLSVVGTLDSPLSSSRDWLFGQIGTTSTKRLVSSNSLSELSVPRKRTLQTLIDAAIVLLSMEHD